MGYIYVIQNKLNLKIYVGQTINPNVRWQQHKSFVASGNLVQVIHRAMNKYGIDNFTFKVIEDWASQEELDEAEVFWIDFFSSRNGAYGYNIAAGGSASWNKGLPAEAQPMYGKHHSLDSKKKTSIKMVGRKNAGNIAQSIPITIDSIHYSSLNEASKILNIPIMTIRYRVMSKSKRFSSYTLEEING